MKCYLDIPTYFDKTFTNFIQEVNEDPETFYKIKHVYGSLSGLFSARESERLPKISGSVLSAHIEELKEIDVDFYYAFNTNCLGALTEKDVEKIGVTLKRISELNVENLIIAHPFLIEFSKKYIKDPSFKMSVIMDIDDSKRISYFTRNNDTIINASTNINRDFNFFINTKKFRDNLELLCNEACLYMCPFRASHYTIESHRKKTDFLYDNYPLENCYELLTDVELIRARFILPEWIRTYSTYAKYFKLSGRTFPREFIEKATLHYSQGFSPENILELFPIVTGSVFNEQSGVYEERGLTMRDDRKYWFLNHFVHHGHKCKYQCPCSFCDTYTKYITKIEKRPEDFDVRF